MNWEIVIGLETHAQLSTASKIFSGASTAFGAAPNTQACAVDIALPGVLPVLNHGAVERAPSRGDALFEPWRCPPRSLEYLRASRSGIRPWDGPAGSCARHRRNALVPVGRLLEPVRDVD